MSIANKLSYLGETKEEIREGLNKLGGNISKSDTFRSYADAIKEIYDSMPKVEESDVESATLEGTIKGGLTIDPKGNTSQIQTTQGKNLIPFYKQDFTKNDVRYYVKDGSLYLNGTSTSETYRMNEVFKNNFKFTLPAGTYTFSKASTDPILPAYIIKYDDDTNLGILSGGSTLTTFTLAEETEVYLGFYIYQKVFNNLAPELMVSLNGGDYEPFVPNSPTPKYPSDINVVSGDNEVVVCGKNLLPFKNQEFTYKNVTYKVVNGKLIINGTSTGETTPNSADFKNNFSFYLEAGTYTIRQNQSAGTNPSYFFTRILKYDDNTALTTISYTTPLATFTLNERTKVYLGFYVYNMTFNNENLEYMLVSGNYTSETIPPYEPYQSQTYPINLTCKNLFDKNGLTYRDGYYLDDNGVEQSNSAIGYTSNIKVQPSTQYTIQGTLESNDGYFRVYYFDSTKTWISRTSGISMSVIPYTFTTPNNCYYVDIQYQKTALDKDTIQLEKGSQATTYQAFTQPIELCKIGDYQDYFTKNSGKNMFDINNLLIAGTYQGQVDYYSPKVEDGVLKSGGKIGTDGGAAVCVDIENIQNVAISFTPTFSDTTSKCQIVGVNTLGSSATTTQIVEITLTNNTKVEYTYQNSNYKYIGLRFYSNTQYGTSIKDLQVEIGSQATTYEPYGTGQWCKYNAIGKKTLVGTETIDMEALTGKYLFKYNTGDMLQQNSGLGLSNYFTRAGTQDIGTIRFGWINRTVYMYMDSNYSTVELFKTWLSTHNTELIYPLATPYLSLIEDETLISQLDNLENAMSYEGQTSINQTNNDLPFKMDIKAILDWRN